MTPVTSVVPPARCCVDVSLVAGGRSAAGTWAGRSMARPACAHGGVLVWAGETFPLPRWAAAIPTPAAASAAQQSQANARRLIRANREAGERRPPDSRFEPFEPFVRT